MRAYLTVLDEDDALVPYFVRHYRRLGATEFPLVVYSDTPGYPDQLVKHVQSLGVGVSLLGSFKSAVFSANHRDMFIHKQHPEGEWGFFADLDEFAALTPERVKRIINASPSYVWGHWVDRVAKGGKLTAVDPTKPLETTYPYGAKVRQRAIRGNADAFVLSPYAPTRHHPTVCRWGRKHRKRATRIDIHHFKWQPNVIPRLQRRLQRIKPAGKGGRSWYRRVSRTLRYLQRFDGIDPRLLYYQGSVLQI